MSARPSAPSIDVSTWLPVGLLERRAEGLLRRRGRVRRPRGRRDLGAGGGGQRGEGQRVGVVDLARAQRLAGGDELVAGGHHGDARAAGDLELAAPGGGG